MTVFLLLLCAHLIGDFLLQNDQLVTAKNAGRIWAHLKHGLCIAGLTWLAVHWYGLKPAFWYAALVGLAHLMLDSAKSWLEKGKAPGSKLFLFLLDQGLHILVLLAFSPLLPAATPDPKVIAFYQRFRLATPVLAPAAPASLAVLSLEKMLWVAVTYLAAVFGGAVLTNRILAWLTGDAQEEKTRRLSSAIGIMERLILITLVAVDAISAVGFVLAAKSLARYQELNKRDFAEYYLVGTLTSFSLSLFAGLWLKTIL
ncbi:MAG: DUF3307 domain-containing protein [Firmicutes bacterium]|nr:DUF3307 domain-containing protein [Bacillota bacterium]